MKKLLITGLIISSLSTILALTLVEPPKIAVLEESKTPAKKAPQNRSLSDNDKKFPADNPVDPAE